MIIQPLRNNGRARAVTIILMLPMLVWAFNSGPDPRSEGGPGGPAAACAQSGCHVGTAVNAGGGRVELQFPNGLVYIPGQKQRIRIVITDSTARTYGFQVSARLASNETNGQAGRLDVIGAGQLILCQDGRERSVSSSCAGSTPLEFIEHSRPSTTNTIEIDWTPPAVANAGNIRFYVAGNAANNNGQNTGDKIYTANYTLSPNTGSAPPQLFVSPASLGFAFLAGGSVPSSQVLFVGASSPAVNFTTSGSTSSGGNWLTVTPSNATTPFSLTVSVNPVGLPAGSYNGNIQMTPINGVPVQIGVALTVTIRPVTTALSPNAAIAGGPAFTLTVNGSGFLTGSSVQWNGMAIPTTFVDATRLTAIVSGELLRASGSAAVTVTNPGGAISNPIPFVITTNPAGALLIITASTLPPGKVGVPYSLALSATGGVTPFRGWAIAPGSQPLPPGIGLSSPGGFLTGLLNGVPTTSGTYSFAVQVTDTAGAVATRQFSLAIAPAMTITSGGIINAASYMGGAVAPGEVVTVFGSGLGPVDLVSLQLDGRGYVSTSLGGTQLLFDGVPAPLIYARNDQVSGIVPYELSGKASTQVHVSFGGQISNTVTVPVVEVAPGIFTADSSGRGQGAIVNQDGTLNSASNPAPAGSIVFLYATGEGQTSPGGENGKPADSPAPQPISQPVTATVGGLSAPVLYAGGVPGLVAGVLQVNVQIPQGVGGSSSSPLILTFGKISTQPGVTVAVR